MDDVTGRHPRESLIKSLKRSQAQIAAGETVPFEPFLDELRESIDRMKAKRAAKTADKQRPA
jgi:hypothetical protein